MSSSLVHLARFVLGLLFVAAGSSKIFDQYGFLSSLYDMDLFGNMLPFFIAWSIPWLEVVVGTALVTGVLLNGAVLLGLILSVSFFAIRLSVIARGLKVNCSCFGQMQPNSSIDVASLLQALVLVIVCAVLFVLLFLHKTTQEIT